MKELEKLQGVQTEEDSLDVLLGLARVCLNRMAPDVGGKEDLDDILDVETIYKIIEVCGGVKLNDPNLIAAATKMAQAEGGQN